MKRIAAYGRPSYYSNVFGQFDLWCAGLTREAAASFCPSTPRPGTWTVPTYGKSGPSVLQPLQVSSPLSFKFFTASFSVLNLLLIRSLFLRFSRLFSVVYYETRSFATYLTHRVYVCEPPLKKGAMPGSMAHFFNASSILQFYLCMYNAISLFHDCYQH